MIIIVVVIIIIIANQAHYNVFSRNLSQRCVTSSFIARFIYYYTEILYVYFLSDPFLLTECLVIIFCCTSTKYNN